MRSKINEPYAKSSDLRTFNRGFINYWRAFTFFTQTIWFIATWNPRKFERKYQIKEHLFMPSTVGHWRFGPCERLGVVVVVPSWVDQIRHIQARTTIWRPKPKELRRSNKIDIWSLILVALSMNCSIWKEMLFNIRSPDKLRDSFRTFQSLAQTEAEKNSRPAPDRNFFPIFLFF